MRTTINIDLIRNSATNNITIENKISTIKSVRDFTFCTLKDAKDMVDNFEKEIQKSIPNDNKVRKDILDCINQLQNQDLIDVLRFARVTRGNPMAVRTIEPGTFDEDGNYTPGNSYDHEFWS